MINLMRDDPHLYYYRGGSRSLLSIDVIKFEVIKCNVT